MSRVPRETSPRIVPRETSQLSLPTGTRERLLLFEDLLRRWNARINLVSRDDLATLWVRHVEDSVQLAGFLTGATAAIDLGSGAGFPGLMLSIVTGLPFTLVEADQRKAAFLREAARLTEATATVTACRIETLRLTADLITARALAPLPRLLELAYPLLHSGGACLFLKGSSCSVELADAARWWHFQAEQHPSVTHPDGVILRLHGIMPRMQQRTSQ